MLPRWLQSLRRFSSNWAPRLSRKRLPSYSPILERLEDRTVPATITWNNAAGGNWATPGNWDLNRAPTTGDDVVIPDLGAPGPSLTVTYSGGTTSVNTVTSSE